MCLKPRLMRESLRYDNTSRRIIIIIIIIAFHPGSEHRPHTSNFHSPLSWAIWVSSPHECPIVTISLSTHLLHVSLGLFRPLLPCGFHLRDCLVKLPLGFLKVWPIQRHFLFPISSFIGTWPALSQRSSFRTLSSHLILRMVLRHLLTKVWTFFNVPAVAFQVSHPYSRTDFTFELKSLNFVFLEILVALHTFPSWVNAALAFPILALTSASVPPLPSIMLPR
jgi:hypothetical protein